MFLVTKKLSWDISDAAMAIPRNYLIPLLLILLTQVVNTASSPKRQLPKLAWGTRNYSLWNKSFISYSSSFNSNSLGYWKPFQIPTIQMEAGWDSKRNRPYKSNMVISTQTQDFAIMSISDGGDFNLGT
jgi:hypothetical protein